MGKRLLCLAALILVFMAGGCGGPGKIQNLQTQKLSASLALSRGELAEERRVIASAPRDTITVTGENGETLLLMKAVRDDDSGEMVAHDVIDAAVVTARFRNVAERHGRVDLRFEVIVPAEMIDKKWQLQFNPDMFILEDSIRLEPVIITGSDFRSRQLRGYELYDKYLRSIITDTTAFIDWRNLNIWIARNMPELYRFRTDSSFVSEDDFHSLFGPTEADAIRHYTLWHRRHYHEKKWDMRGRKFKEYVKAPIKTEGIRLDTVLRDIDGNFVYQYTQSIQTRPKLRKVDIVLSGDIFEQEKHLYTMPRSEPLTFYISSLSAFVDTRERYLTRILERKAAANTACWVDFASGSSEIDLSLSHNGTEIRRIKGNMVELLENTAFDLDSIVISASASPEGALKANNILAERRAASVAAYFDSYIRHWKDSVGRNSFSVSVDDGGRERIGRSADNSPSIPFLSRSSGENWSYLGILVDEDTVMTAGDKFSFIRHLETADVDERERGMQAEPWYRYMRENLYPKLRTVRFDFYLHRKGMVKDTVHTTELDTLYMRGVRLLQEREYEKALTILRDYRDYNTAIAYVSMDYNASAMSILHKLPRTPQVSYMLALLYARAGDDGKAVENYLRSCREDRSYVFRGNLDPEIYVLIQRYGLNKEEDNPIY